MAPETHTRYRVQRLIRLGEWLEKNQDTLVLAFDVIDEAHDMLVDPLEGLSESEVIEMAGFKQLQALQSMQRLMMELRHNIPTKHVRRGVDVTIHHPYATKGEWEVVMEAPQAKNILSQQQYNIEEQERLKAEYDAAQAEPTPEEFDKVRSEVDGI